MNELRRVKIPPALHELSVQGQANKEVLDLASTTVEELKHLTLGSRKNLCIYEKVSSLGSATAINERCLDLQKSGKSSNAVVEVRRLTEAAPRYSQGMQMSPSSDKGESDSGQ